MLAAGVVVLFLLVVPYYSRTVYIDVKAGRIRIVKQFYLIPVSVGVQDSFFTEQYRKYVSSELPPPEWWFSSETEKGILWGKTYSDSQDARAFAYQQEFQDTSPDGMPFADAEAWKAFLTTLTGIYTLPKSKPARHETAMIYRVSVSGLRRTLNRPLRATDLPSIEDTRRELEKRLRGGSQ